MIVTKFNHACQNQNPYFSAMLYEVPIGDLDMDEEGERRSYRGRTT